MGEWRTAVPDEYKDQVEELYQKQKREAEAETYEALKQDMLDHQRSISKHTVEEHLQSVIKTICTTDLRSLLKRMPQFEKLLRKIARLEVLGDHLFQKQSKGWLEHVRYIILSLLSVRLEETLNAQRATFVLIYDLALTK